VKLERARAAFVHLFVARSLGVAVADVARAHRLYGTASPLLDLAHREALAAQMQERPN
jgi:hypothetical protein